MYKIPSNEINFLSVGNISGETDLTNTCLVCTAVGRCKCGVECLAAGSQCASGECECGICPNIRDSDLSLLSYSLVARTLNAGKVDVIIIAVHKSHLSVKISYFTRFSSVDSSPNIIGFHRSYPPV